MLEPFSLFGRAARPNGATRNGPIRRDAPRPGRHSPVRTALAWVGICCTALAVPSAQTSSQSQQAQVIAVVGCLAQEGGSWLLTSATEPIWAPAPGGGQSSVGVTVEIANKQPPGKGRYRLIGVLEEFSIPAHKGHKMLVKGLLIVDGRDRRINITSATMAAATCR